MATSPGSGYVPSSAIPKKHFERMTRRCRGILYCLIAFAMISSLRPCEYMSAYGAELVNMLMFSISRHGDRLLESQVVTYGVPSIDSLVIGVLQQRQRFVFV